MSQDLVLTSHCQSVYLCLSVYCSFKYITNFKLYQVFTTQSRQKQTLCQTLFTLKSNIKEEENIKLLKFYCFTDTLVKSSRTFKHSTLVQSICHILKSFIQAEHEFMSLISTETIEKGSSKCDFKLCFFKKKVSSTHRHKGIFLNEICQISVCRVMKNGLVLPFEIVNQLLRRAGRAGEVIRIMLGLL